MKKVLFSYHLFITFSLSAASLRENFDGLESEITGEQSMRVDHWNSWGIHREAAGEERGWQDAVHFFELTSAKSSINL